jgi:hypothetical protein
MENIVILGQGGLAGTNICTQLDVDPTNKFAFDNQCANNIKAKVTDVGVLNWIGHGSVQNLKTDGKALWPSDAAQLFEELGPTKIVLWSCNTGLCRAKKNLKTALWKAYTGTEAYTKTDDFKFTTTIVKEIKKDPTTGRVVRDNKGIPVKADVVKKSLSEDYKKYQKSPSFQKTFGEMKVEVTAEEMAGGMEQSVVYQIAQNMNKSHGVSVYGPKMGISPSAIKSFLAKDGQGNLIQWETQNANDPTTVCSEDKWRYLAVDNDKRFKIICKCRPDNGKYICTLHSQYVDQ